MFILKLSKKRKKKSIKVLFWVSHALGPLALSRTFEYASMFGSLIIEICQKYNFLPLVKIQLGNLRDLIRHKMQTERVSSDGGGKGVWSRSNPAK